MRFLLVLAVSLLASAAFAQTMYKCVDARGVTRYTDQPQPGCKGREVQIQGQPPVSGTLPPPKQDAGQVERDHQRRKMDEDRIREAQRNTAEKIKRQCDQLQAEVERMESGRRIVTFNEKGEPTYVEDDERSQRAAKLREEIALQKCR
jgi:hypothetical protein